MAHYLTTTYQTRYIMIKHYLKTGVRNLTRYKTQSLISIIGLAIGFTFFAVGYHWYKYETSYDRFYPESEQTYRIYTVDKQTGKILFGAPPILCSVLREDFPEVKYAVTLCGGGDTYSCDNNTLGSPSFKWVSEDFVQLFPPKVIAGSTSDPIPVTASGAATNLMVTKEFALKHWNSPEEAIGKTLTNQYNFTHTITAVIENPVENTVFREEGYYSISIRKSSYNDRSPDYYWSFPPFEMYLCLRENINVNTFRQKLRTYTIDNKYNPNLYIELIPIAEARYKLGAEMSFNLGYIRTFTIAGLLLLFCALFNFINLQVNRFFERSREFKLRSSLGAVKQNLFLQMTVEISIQVLIALLASISLIELSTSYIEQILDTTIHKKELLTELFLLGGIGWILLLLVICIFISRFIYKLPDSVRTGKEDHTIRREWIRKLNIGLQLVICVGFMFTALILFQQISRMKNTSMGFDKENLIQVSISDQIYFQFVEEVKKIPGIISYIQGGNFRLQHESMYTQKEIGWDNKPLNSSYEIHMIQTGIHFAREMGIPLVKGRYLEDTDMHLDDPSGIVCHKILINEQMAGLLGSDDPIGKQISRQDYIIRGTDKPSLIYYEIVGVVKDFHGLSLRNPIAPTIMECWKTIGSYFYLRTLPGKEKEVLNAVRKLITDISPEGFKRSEAVTLNEQLNQLTRTENASLRLFTLLAVLCVLISIFGIYSISASNMQQRKKEIAIRKVMGASSSEVIRMFLKKYIVIALFANAIALPIAYLFCKKWLEQYPDPITIHVGIFLYILLTTIILVISTILCQIIKAAGSNPSEVIKSN